MGWEECLNSWLDIRGTTGACLVGALTCALAQKWKNSTERWLSKHHRARVPCCSMTEVEVITCRPSSTPTRQIGCATPTFCFFSFPFFGRIVSALRRLRCADIIQPDPCADSTRGTGRTDNCARCCHSAVLSHMPDRVSRVNGVPQMLNRSSSLSPDVSSLYHSRGRRQGSGREPQIKDGSKALVLSYVAPLSKWGAALALPFTKVIVYSRY